MKNIKEGLINEEIVRRYPGSDNGGNYVIDKGKGGGLSLYLWRVLIIIGEIIL